MSHFIKSIQITLLFSLFSINAQIVGCTDGLANNFNVNATQNDGSCTYNPTTVNSVTSWLLPATLNETSGLLMYNNKIWTHNDDTDTNLYAFDLNNSANFITYPLLSAINNDWEEIAQDANYIYVGDFGNNVNGNRTDLKILRISKLSLLQNTPVIETIAYSYSTQTNFSPTGSNNTNFDCEAFIVTNDNIYLFTKEWVSNKSSLYSLPKNPGTHSASFISEFNVQGLITGATYLENKKLVVLSGYSNQLQPFIISLYGFQNNSFFGGNKRKMMLNLPFHQIEGITTEDGINYYVSNEKFINQFITIPASINKINLTDYLSNYLNSLSNVEHEIVKPDFVTLYPNPTSAMLNFKVETQNFNDLKLMIFSSNGQKVGEQSITSNSFQINTSNFDKGLYFFSITGNSEIRSSGKFIIK